MLSRVAESLYWMSRYIERAENIARFIDVNLHLMLDIPIYGKEQWEPLVTATGDHEFFEQRYGDPKQENVLEFLAFDPSYPNSILSCLTAARENARSVREVISSEMWQQVNSFYLSMKGQPARDQAAENPHDFFNDVKLNSQLFIGISEGTLSHGEGWHFLNLGRLLERADKTSRILDVKYFMLLPRLDYVGSPYDNILWAALLKSASAFEMYKKNHHRITPIEVADFLMFHKDFPRSITYCLEAAEESLQNIIGTPSRQYRNQAQRNLGKLASELNYTEIDEVIDSGLHEFLDGFQGKLNRIGSDIHQAFFAMTPAHLPATMQTEG